ncbi:MAG: tetratricopeptide repeat protein [bacterium]|nr:tetratricopeptide repeat protein [bacterium]
MSDFEGTSYSLISTHELGVVTASAYIHDDIIVIGNGRTSISSDNGRTWNLTDLGLTGTTVFGHYGEALELVLRGLVIHEQIGDLIGVAYTYSVLGNIYTNTHRFDDALELFPKGITLAAEIDDQMRVADLKRSTGYVYFLQSMYADALLLFESSRQQFAELGMIPYQIDSAIGSALCSLKLEALETAGTDAGGITSSDLLARTQALVGEEDFTMSEYERQSSEWLEGLSKFGITLDE